MNSSRSISSIAVFVIISVGIRLIARNYAKSRDTQPHTVTIPQNYQYPNIHSGYLNDDTLSIPAIPFNINQVNENSIEQEVNSTFQECRVSIDKIFDFAKSEYSDNPSFQKTILQMQLDEMLKNLNAVPVKTPIEKEFKQLVMGKINWYIKKRMNEFKIENDNKTNQNTIDPVENPESTNPILNSDSTKTN